MKKVLNASQQIKLNPLMESDQSGHVLSYHYHYKNITLKNSPDSIFIFI